MNDGKKTYDWAQALLAMATSDSRDLNELAAIADLDPVNGDLCDVDLSDIDLSGQNLSGWDLRNANLKNARLTGTELRNAAVDPWELVQAIDWREAELDADLRELTSRLNPDLLTLIDKLEFSVRSANCFRNANCIYVGDLVQKTEAELLRTQYFGRKSLNETKEVLAQMGLHLGMDVPGWPPQRLLRRR